MTVRRRTLVGGFAALGGAWAAGAAWAQEASALARVKQRGRLSVAVYNEHPPFHVAGKGIEVDLAQALAKQLGVEATLMPFTADENMDDDLRHMVWRGHYLGFGPADVMLHVPVDRPLMQNNPQVRIFGPYYRERLVMARNLAELPQLESMASVGQRPIAVPGLSLAGWLLIGADDGAYRGQLQTKWKDGTETAKALQRGDVAVAAGLASEMESVLAGDARFAIEPLPLPRAKDGWAVGMATKRAADDLAQALQAAVNTLSDNGELKAIFAAGKVGWRKP